MIIPREAARVWRASGSHYCVNSTRARPGSSPTTQIVTRTMTQELRRRAARARPPSPQRPDSSEVEHSRPHGQAQDTRADRRLVRARCSTGRTLGRGVLRLAPFFVVAAFGALVCRAGGGLG